MTTTTETKHAKRRREREERDAATRQHVLDHIEKLELGPTDVLYLRLENEYFEEPHLARAVEEFANAIGQMTRRPVFMMRMNQRIEAGPPPRPKAPTIATPPKELILPTGVKVPDDLRR